VKQEHQVTIIAGTATEQSPGDPVIGQAVQWVTLGIDVIKS
jgi:hypothetical protein